MLPALDASLTRFDLKPVQQYYLEQALALVDQSGVPMVMLPTPVSGATAAALRPAVREAYGDFIASVTAAHPNVLPVGDPFPVWRDEYFGDDTHLNREGALLFTARLNACLRRWLAKPSAVTLEPCDLPPP
jgi:hypothetical protein